MGEILSNPPVFHTLVQIYFQENPNLKDNFESIYQELHKKGFIEKRRETIQHHEFSTTNNELKVTQQDSWHYINFEQDTGFVLNKNFFVLHTTNYTNYSNFIEQFKIGLEVLNNHLDFLVVDRIGLRYLDCINIKDENEKIENVLSSEQSNIVHGVGLDEDGYMMQHSMLEKILINPEANKTCVARIVTALLDDQEPLMPQELIPLIKQLNLKEKFKKNKGLAFLLDIDCSKVELRLKSNQVESIVDYVDDLHDNISKVFNKIIMVEGFANVSN
ncbi:TIGR04255 family protein [Acinetobacter guillouiae]|uniref:TIGR04255 family protein n=1 Tax=Acinetobacter guillouiae TaxID=106649 RepID=UPI001AE3EF39|nr:TIGR04255 family protein [Acinetobacter guillouiae]MBP2546436.1 uncharacterized protein (TIGR04255 family) [Acinetobacter guillouiae]